MDTQLQLLDPPADAWRLDDRTREVGRRGLLEARRALAQATPRTEDRSAA